MPCLIATTALPVSAQPTLPENVMEMEDISRPPTEGVAPKPIGPRDLTMANYPRESFVSGEEGTVHLRALVQADGAVRDALIERSSGSPRLDQAAVELVRGWRYEPGTLKGVPVAARFPVNIDWKLMILPITLPPSTNPELVKFYPSTSIRLQEQGNATIRFLVTSEGTVANAIVAKSSGHVRLDDAAIKFIKEYWRFKPATLVDGSPVGVWFETNVSFALKKDRRY
jgi:TonB family protein